MKMDRLLKLIFGDDDPDIDYESELDLAVFIKNVFKILFGLFVITFLLWTFTSCNMLKNEYNFNIDDINNIRSNLTEIRKPLYKSPQGWSKSVVDPNRLIDYFPALRIKTGYKLVSYQFIEDLNGNGFVWAIPCDASFPEPDQCQWLVGRSFLKFFEVPKPLGALDDFMECIEGDDTPLAYLSASIFARETNEFGAIWHGCRWDTHEILSSELKKIDPIPYALVLKDMKRPVKLTPRVIVGRDTVKVIFYTYSGLNEEAVCRHVDTYKRGSYVFTTEETIVAKGQGGYYF